MTVKAHVGDRVVVRSRHVGGPVRAGEIVEVWGDHGTPPYVVRWNHDVRTRLFFPGSDATCEAHPDTAHGGAARPGSAVADELSDDEVAVLLNIGKLGSASADQVAQGFMSYKSEWAAEILIELKRRGYVNQPTKNRGFQGAPDSMPVPYRLTAQGREAFEKLRGVSS